MSGYNDRLIIIVIGILILLGVIWLFQQLWFIILLIGIAVAYVLWLIFQPDGSRGQRGPM